MYRGMKRKYFIVVLDQTPSCMNEEKGGQIFLCRLWSSYGEILVKGQLYDIFSDDIKPEFCMHADGKFLHMYFATLLLILTVYFIFIYI